MTLLLLGGTSEAKQLANTLHHQGIRLIYSIAGLVRTPSLESEVVIGGFSQFGGLDCFIKENNISVDVRSQGIRISPHIYNDEANMSHLLEVIKTTKF